MMINANDASKNIEKSIEQNLIKKQQKLTKELEVLEKYKEEIINYLDKEIQKYSNMGEGNLTLNHHHIKNIVFGFWSNPLDIVSPSTFCKFITPILQSNGYTCRVEKEYVDDYYNKILIFWRATK